MRTVEMKVDWIKRLTEACTSLYVLPMVFRNVNHISKSLFTERIIDDHAAQGNLPFRLPFAKTLSRGKGPDKYIYLSLSVRLTETNCSQLGFEPRTLACRANALTTRPPSPSDLPF